MNFEKKIIFLLGFLRGVGVKIFTILLIFDHPSKAWVTRFPKIYNMSTFTLMTKIVNIVN